MSFRASFGSLAAGSGQNSLGGGGQGFAGLGSTQGFGGQGIPSSSTSVIHLQVYVLNVLTSLQGKQAQFFFMEMSHSL